MSKTLVNIQALAKAGKIRISEHGYDELANDGLTAREIVDGLMAASLLEDYPDYPKGACVLVLQQDRHGKPVHAVWGIPKNQDQPAVLVTAYKPDPTLWDENFARRRK